MRILVTGASGLLGLNLCLTKAEEFEVFGVVHQNQLKNVPFEVIIQDLRDRKSVRRIFDIANPDIAINCAAMANIDDCEKYPEAAREINAIVPSYIANACAEGEIPFIQISTDAVFDGLEGNYLETDAPNPLSTYARTKLEGEKTVLEANPQSLIVRVNFFGFSISRKRSLAEFFLFNLMSGKKILGFTDIMFSPLYVGDLVRILFEMIDKKLSGIFHVVSHDHLSKYDFGVLIGNKFNLDTSLIKPTSVKEGKLLARRSPNLTLMVDKILSTGIQVPNVAAAVEHFYIDHQNGLSDRIRSFSTTED